MAEVAPALAVYSPGTGKNRGWGSFQGLIGEFGVVVRLQGCRAVQVTTES